VWPNRRAIIDGVAPILAAQEIMGAFAVGCLIEGPVKLDVFFERRSNLAARKRIAVKRLWGPEETYAQFRLGDDLGADEIARMLQYNVGGILQGASWPVRMLARGQVDTFLFSELFVIETVIVPLMLLERDPRTFHRNMFTRSKMLNDAERKLYTHLTDRVVTAVRGGDLSAIRDAHIELVREFGRLAKIAYERFKLEFPPRIEEEMIAFFNREWPVA